MKNKQAGFTTLEALIAVIFVVGILLFCGLVYVAIHFLMKVW